MTKYLQIIIFICASCFASLSVEQNNQYAQTYAHTYKYNHPVYDMAVEDITIDLEHPSEEYLMQYASDDTSVFGTVSSRNARHVVTSSRTTIARVIKRYHNNLRQTNSTTIKEGKTIDCRTIINHIEDYSLLPMASKSCNEFITLICRFIIEP